MRQGLDYDISLGPGATVKRSRGDGAVTSAQWGQKGGQADIGF